MSDLRETSEKPLLNVTQLREQLERIERHGCGQWEVDVYPEQADLAFDIRRYGVIAAVALGDGSQNFVLLKVASAPQDGS